MSLVPFSSPLPGDRQPGFPRRPLVDGLALVRRVWRVNPPLAVVGFITLALLVPFAVGVFVDPRVITGAPAWLKPAKFAASFGIYALTLVWFLSFVRGHRRLVAAIAWGTAVATAVEIAVIALQAGRGTTSHYNTATPLDSALFVAMGVSVVVVFLLGMATALLLLRQRAVPPALAMALRLGLAGSLVGMVLAAPMFGDPMGHAVGVADGGPGLSFLGWSTEGGGLRVGHFVGLHAMQVLPLLGFTLARSAPQWLGAGRQAALVGVAGAAWIGLSLLLTWQALRAQPLLTPDAATLGVLAALVAAATSAAAAIVLPARPAAE